MIIFYDDAGNIRELSTWTLLNPDTCEDDGAMLIEGVGLRGLHPAGYHAVAYDPSVDMAAAVLAEEIRRDLFENGGAAYAIGADRKILLNGNAPVRKDVVPVALRTPGFGVIDENLVE